jgi:beta-galactosidase
MDITLVDENGIVHISKDRLITVNLEGAGQLIGFGSGSPMTTENYLDNECTTYKGRALAVILPTEPGVITVTVSDGNGQAACVDITCI